jgi:hypothetical protein
MKSYVEFKAEVLMKKVKLRITQILVILQYIYYWFYCKIFRIKNDDVWLLSERGDEARDNAYCFYKYMLKEHPNVNFKYVIAKDSVDLKKIQNPERVVFYRSKEHFILFITAGYLISTHIMGCSPEFRIFLKLDKWNLVKIRGKRVHLDHGIVKDKSEGLHYGNIKLDLMISGAKPEYDFMKDTFGYPNGIIQYTGKPRYDYLISTHKKQILVMPTWRMNLFYCPNISEFKKTEYFKNWNAVLNSKKLHDYLNECGYKLYFYPHYEIQPYIKAFEIENKNIVIADFDHYDVQQLLYDSQLLITDYSSVFFDFAYMGKPVIYFQFDYEEYRLNHFKEGYFSYEQDGFGPVIKNEKNVINQIIGYIKNDFLVEKKYTDNRNRFFTLEPGKNCERVYDAIINIK